MYYFAYGSNLDTAQMQRRCPGSHPVGAARLDHYGLQFDGTSQNWNHHAAANVVPQNGGTVWGALYEVTDEHLEQLDGFERNYQREQLGVVSDKLGHVIAQVYIRPARTIGKPSTEYLAAIVRGAKENGLPNDYISQVIQTAGLEPLH